MIRNKKSTCGISNFECRKPTFRTFQPEFVSDPINYNVKPDLIKDRKSILNFYNIPRMFQGVISSTLFIEIKYPFTLLLVGFTCVDVLNPFSDRTRYLYATSAVELNPNYIKAWYAKDKQEPTKFDIFMDTYFGASGNVLLQPGILMPAATMAPFNTIGAIALPTAALATASRSSVTKHRSTNSGCPTGFYVTTNISNNDAYIKIEPGTVSVGTAAQKNDPTGLLNNISNVFLQRSSPADVLVKSDACLRIKKINLNFRCSIYAIAYIDLLLNKNKVPGLALSWNAYLFADVFIGDDDNNAQMSESLIELMSKLPLPKYRLIANIIWNADSKTFDITSTLCSPVDLRDWVSLVGIPKSLDGDTSLMVFGMYANSLVKKWFKVKDC